MIGRIRIFFDEAAIIITKPTHKPYMTFEMVID